MIILKINWHLFRVTGYNCFVMIKNFKIVIEYDGTSYFGWQRQPDKKTVQGEIEKALSIMTKTKVDVHGSGRTDAGVHALNQVAHFKCETNITPEGFQQGISSLVPDSILIKECSIAAADFHARINAKRKTYHYRILNTKKPVVFDRNYSWFFYKHLDLEAMQKASECLVGTYDFKAFENTGSPKAHTIREIYNAKFNINEPGYLIFEITGNGFLKNMVRNIVGALTEVGLKKISPDDFRKILLSKDRANAFATAPPHGLYLIKVEY